MGVAENVNLVFGILQLSHRAHEILPLPVLAAILVNGGLFDVGHVGNLASMTKNHEITFGTYQLSYLLAGIYVLLL